MRGPFCARPAISFSMREVDEAVFFSSQCVERTRFWMASERADCFFGAMRLPTLGFACVDDLPLAGVGRLRGLKPCVMAPGTNGAKIRPLFFGRASPLTSACSTCSRQAWSECWRRITTAH